MRRPAVLAAYGIALALATAPVTAAEIKVISSTAMREALEALAPQFERTSGHTVALRFESGALLPGVVRADTPADLIVTTPNVLAQLTADGKVRTGSTVDFARSSVGLAVRAGAPKPDIGTEAAFKAALLAAKSVGISQGPSGVYLLTVLDRLGIADAIKAKMVQPALGQRVGILIADGRVEIGLQQITELLPIPGIDFVGPLPAGLQTSIVYAVADASLARAPAAAHALAAFLVSSTAAPTLRKLGLEPAG
jgi:molybdate transport system substrate-binding protein